MHNQRLPVSTGTPSCLPKCKSAHRACVQSCSYQVEGLRDRRNPAQDGAESDSGSDDADEGGAEGNLDFALFKRTKVRKSAHLSALHRWITLVFALRLRLVDPLLNALPLSI